MLDAAAETKLLAAVRAAARSQILPRYRALSSGDIRTKSRPDDLVTEADLAVERLLTEQMPDILPGALVLGEEAASVDPGLIDRATRSDLCVIIDPVDGTWNFANGLSVFGTIIAVVHEGETQWGLLYDPLMDDWIIARRGGGVSYTRPGQNPIPCDLPPAPPLAKQIGLMAPALFPATERGGLMRNMIDGFDRTMGLRCSCHEYRLMLQAGAHWSLSHTPMPWDHAAGVLAMEELGGTACFVEDGARYSPSRTHGTLLVAGSPTSWAKVRETLYGSDVNLLQQ